MSNLTRALINDALPKGPAWEPAEGGGMDLLLEAMADNHELVRLFLSTFADVRSPNTTFMLEDLEKEFGIKATSTLSEATRRMRLANVIYDSNGHGSENDLGTALRSVGFDVHVYQNDPAVDPAVFLNQQFQMVAGGDNAYAGRDDAFAGRIGGELLVNGGIFIMRRSYTSIAGEMWAGDGTTAGEYDRLIVENQDYPIPNNPTDWQMVFFVGGPATYGYVDIVENGGFETGTFNDFTQNNATLEGYNGYTQWQATTIYGLGALRVPTLSNGYKYEVTTAGTSGASEPTWPTTPGGTVIDGTVTWTCREFITNTGSYASSLVASAANIEGAETVSYDIHPLRTYTISVANNVTICATGNYRNRIEFRDENDLLISTETLYSKAAVTSGYEVNVKTIGPIGVATDLNIPPTARKIRVYQDWYNLSGNPSGTAYMDDVVIYRSDKQSITAIELAIIDGAREDEFKTTILKYKPLHSWSALIVTFA